MKDLNHIATEATTQNEYQFVGPVSFGAIGGSEAAKKMGLGLIAGIHETANKLSGPATGAAIGAAIGVSAAGPFGAGVGALAGAFTGMMTPSKNSPSR